MYVPRDQLLVGVSFVVRLILLAIPS